MGDLHCEVPLIYWMYQFISQPRIWKKSVIQIKNMTIHLHRFERRCSLLRRMKAR